MHHHAESPELIHAKLAEWERTAETHRAQHEAARLLAVETDSLPPHPVRLLVDRLQRLLRPAARMREQPGA